MKKSLYRLIILGAISLFFSSVALGDKIQEHDEKMLMLSDFFEADEGIQATHAGRMIYGGGCSGEACPGEGNRVNMTMATVWFCTSDLREEDCMEERKNADLTGTLSLTQGRRAALSFNSMASEMVRQLVRDPFSAESVTSIYVTDMQGDNCVANPSLGPVSVSCDGRTCESRDDTEFEFNLDCNPS